MVNLSSKKHRVQHVFLLSRKKEQVPLPVPSHAWLQQSEERRKGDGSEIYSDVLGVGDWPWLTLSAGLEAVANCVSRYNVCV